MSRAISSEIPKESEMMNDFWKFRKDFYYPEDSDDYWNQIMESANTLSKKYNSEYMDQLLLVCVNEIEQRFMRSVPDGIVLGPGKQFENTYKMLKVQRSIARHQSQASPTSGKNTVSVCILSNLTLPPNLSSPSTASLMPTAPWPT